jgi:TetR/AcrR family transcriptional regulator, copper-responsive repressor
MAGGRQREFEKDEALDKAMRIFWQKGFAGASLADLTAAMGINKPSMYAAFGNKEQLFVEATNHYIENYAKQHTIYLLQEGKTLTERLKEYLLSAVAAQCDACNPGGCYISLCISESVSEAMPEQALQTIEKARDFTEKFLTDFFAQEIASNHLSADHKPHELALFFISVLHGTAAMARGGKNLAELATVVDNALTALRLS